MKLTNTTRNSIQSTQFVIHKYTNLRNVNAMEHYHKKYNKNKNNITKNVRLFEENIVIIKENKRHIDSTED